MDFAPERAVTRQEMAVILLSYAIYKGYEMPEHRDMLNYSDMGRIAEEAVTAVNAVTQAGVMSGYSNRFSPARSATRAEVAQLFKNFVRFVVD